MSLPDRAPESLRIRTATVFLAILLFVLSPILAQVSYAAILYENTPAVTTPSNSIFPATLRPVQSSVRLGASSPITIQAVTLKLFLSSSTVSSGAFIDVTLVGGGVHYFTHVVQASELDAVSEIVFTGSAILTSDFFLDPQPLLFVGGFVNNQIFGTTADSYGGSTSCVSMSNTFPTCDNGLVSGLTDLWFRMCDSLECGPNVPTTPHIDTISPMAGPVGTLVTITGENFGNTQGSSSRCSAGGGSLEDPTCQ